MPGCSKSFQFKFQNYEEYGFDGMPKGDLMRCGVNPYNGTVVFKYNNHQNGFLVIDQLMNQIHNEMNSLEEATEIIGFEALARYRSGDAEIEEALRKHARREIVRRLTEALNADIRGHEERKAV